MYTPTEFNTAADKEAFEKRFKRFVQHEFQSSIFTHSFYNRMSMMKGHIAHYNQYGFYEAQFSTHEVRADFLRHWTDEPCYGNPAYTWSDVEKVLAQWLGEHPEFLKREMDAHHALVERAERAELARLSAKYD